MKKAILLVGVAAVLAGCNPFGLPSTRALENGVEATLSSAKSFQIAGTYGAAGNSWTITVQIARPDREHIVAQSGGEQLEAVVIGSSAYFRGTGFLTSHVTDPQARQLVAAVGDSWWSGISVDLPSMPDLTSGSKFRADFLGQAVTKRVDNQQVSGNSAIELSGARADVYVSSDPPYPLLRVRLHNHVTVDGITGADFLYSGMNQDFGIQAPTNVIDFSQLSSLPPIYTVTAVNTSQCTSPCQVIAVLKNLGGLTGAIAPSTVTFTMSDPISGRSLGTCTTTVVPDVGYNQTTSVTCTINAQPVNAAVITAVATNPGKG